jgi:glycosyltransferase involved in cell wall biosynthesis
MKILLVNKFFFLKGGTERSFFDTARILTEKGHKVIFFSMEDPNNFDSSSSEYFIKNIDFTSPLPFMEKIRGAAHLIYSAEAKKKIKKIIKDEHPDIVHLHNIHSQISPSILSVLKNENIPCVMTLHDYKMVCPVYTLFLRGKTCERCSQKKFYHCLLNKCTKNSYMKSLLNTLEMYIHHSVLHIYDLVDAFISPSHFLIDKLGKMGFTKSISYVPNPIFPDEFKCSYNEGTRTLMYFGRLSHEKGLHTLLKAVKGIDADCQIHGQGPLEHELKKVKQREQLDNVTFYGHSGKEEIIEFLKRALFVVMPSEWYENSPYAVMEAFASGKPVIGSHIGGIPEFVIEKETGLTFQPGNEDELRHHILYFLNNPDKVLEMGKKARKLAEEKLNPAAFYDRLFSIYEKVAH